MSFQETKATRSQEQICQYMLSLGHVTTLNGKFLITVLIFLFLLIIPSNTALIYSMIKTKEIKTNTCKILLALSIGDMFAALVLIPTHITVVHLQKYPCIFYSIKHFLEVFLGTSATLLTLGMGLDRYIIISKPHFHTALQSKAPVLPIYLAITYAVSIAFGSSVVGIILSNASIRFSIVFNLASIAVYVFVLSSSLIVNGLLLTYIHRQTKQIRRLSNTHIQSSYQQRATKTVVIISCIQFLTIAPWLISLTYMTFEFIKHIEDKQYSSTLYYIHMWLKMPMYVYSFLNSSVFLYRNKVLVKFIKSKICTK